MMKLLIASICLVSSLTWASPHQVIDTLGASPKGQYVALEEYGYKLEKHSYYVTIRIMNVWTKEYVGKPVLVELPAIRPKYLKEARLKAKILAQDELKRFQISG